MVRIRDKTGIEPAILVPDAKYTWFFVSLTVRFLQEIGLLLTSLSNNLHRMAVIGFICFVSVLGNFYQAIYDDIIYDDFGTGVGKLLSSSR